MTIDPKTIAQVRDAIGRLDLSAENARIAEINGQIAEIDAAISTGRARCGELTSRVRSFDQVDAAAVADSMIALAPRRATAQGLSRAEAEAERSVVQAGLAELETRLAALRLELEQIRRRARQRVFVLCEPVFDEAMAEAKIAAARLLELLTFVAGVGRPLDRQASAEHALRRAVDGVGFQLASRGEPVSTPVAVFEVFGAIGVSQPALQIEIAEKLRV